MIKKNLFIADLRSHNSNGKRTGHYVPLAEMYQKIFGDTYDVFIAGGPVYRSHFKEKDLCLLPYNVSGTSLRDKWHTLKNAMALFKMAKGEIIVLQQATVVTCILALALFYRRTSKLYMIQYSDEGVRTWLRRFIYRFARNKIDGTICPNDKVGKAYGIPYLSIPDYLYVEDKYLEKNFSYKEKIYDFCILGRISPEKGVIDVIKYLKDTDYKIIIAGQPQTSEIENQLEVLCKNQKNIILEIGYLDNDKYLHYLSMSKYCILNYLGEYSLRSSGVVYDMIFNNVPVVGRKCTALQLIKEYELGYLYEDLSDFCPNEFLKESKYDKYIQNIYKYKEKHKLYVQQLKSFIKP